MPELKISVIVTDEALNNLLAHIAANGTVVTGDDDAEGETGQAAPAGAVDKNGVPWLEATHAPSKTFNKDGTWRGKKGVTPQQREAAEAPYRAAAASVAATTAPVPAIPAAAPAMPGFVAPTMPGMPMPGFPPVAAPIPDVPVSYEEMAATYQAVATAGKITPEGVMAIYARLSIDPSTLAVDESARRRVVAELKKL